MAQAAASFSGPRTMAMAAWMAAALSLGWPGSDAASGAEASPGKAIAGEGFGARTAGGEGRAVVRVTTLADKGPGSLREALSGGDRIVEFDVGGVIELARRLEVMGANLTVDGLTAPAPGITLRGEGLVVRGTHGAHDVIVRGIRVRDAPDDGVQIAHDAYNIVVDHVSVHGAGDGSIDVTHGARDVTISWCILAHPASEKNMLIKYGARRVTLHHNLFVGSTSRNPQISNGTESGFAPASETIADVRNNVIADWGGGEGTRVRDGARANIVNNFYVPLGGDKRDTVVIERETQARAFVTGNASAIRLPMNIDGLSTEPAPFEAPEVVASGAAEAAEAVLAGAGVRPLDAIDRECLEAVRPGIPVTAGFETCFFR